MTKRSVEVRSWLADPPDGALRQQIGRIARLPGARRVVVLPDAHPGGVGCNGVVVACDGVLYPDLVGGDIGCGFGVAATDVRGADLLALRPPLLAALRARVPIIRHARRAAAPPLPVDLPPPADARVRAATRRDGAIEFGTLGRGNHFVEFEADEDDRVWIAVHSGSRGMGQLIRAAHLERAERVAGGLRALDVRDEPAEAYLHDMAWARAYAAASRTVMVAAAQAALAHVLGVRVGLAGRFDRDHNHVVSDEVDGAALWIHRKGANPVVPGAVVMIAGSMATPSYHVDGRPGARGALDSCSHGAGRRMSRFAARRIPLEVVRRELAEVTCGAAATPQTAEESPSAYRDVQRVLRAQRKLVRIVRRLRPLLVLKAST